LIDRIRSGEVIDFLDFALMGHHWPALNVGDAAITVGVGFLILHFFRHKSEVHTEVTRRVSVSAGETPKRLDVFVSTHTASLSRAAVQRLIGQGAVTVNGRPAKPSLKIKPGDAIEWDMPQPTPLEIAGEPIPLEILFEDKHLLVLNKPAGLVAHPAPGHWSGTLVNV